jgi:hypothetical protein
MNRFLVFVLLMAMTALGTEIRPPSIESNQPAVTFNQDVLPILQNNCQSCHHAGGIAPMAFTSYESTRPWAKAIKAAVISKQMPPWFADPHVGEFRNAPKLTAADVRVLTAWADSGAREGSSPSELPQLKWKDGWRTQPDVIVSMNQPYVIPARGNGEIKQFVIPNPFKEDTWVSSIEIRPGNASVVHHVLLQVANQAGPGGVFKKAVVNCTDCVQKAVFTAADQAQVAAGAAQQLAFRVAADAPFNAQGSSYNDAFVKLQERMTGRGAFTTMEAVYAPGTQPIDFQFMDSAKLIPGGVPLRIEVHYTPNGKETTDQTMVGFTLAKNPAKRQFVIMAPEHLVDIRKPIPAGDTNWETKGELTFNQDADLVWFMPHMHLRGKDMSFRLIYPDDREETVLSAKFNFNWQLGYELEKPVKVTKGTRMIVTAHHDNSANNPMNPTPGDAVGWGEMTAQEMMLPWFGVVVEGDTRPDMIASYKPGDLDGPFPMGAPMKAVVQGVGTVRMAK